MARHGTDAAASSKPSPSCFPAGSSACWIPAASLNSCSCRVLSRVARYSVALSTPTPRFSTELQEQPSSVKHPALMHDLIGSQGKDKHRRYPEPVAGRSLAKKSSRVGTTADPCLDDPITDYQEVLGLKSQICKRRKVIAIELLNCTAANQHTCRWALENAVFGVVPARLEKSWSAQALSRRANIALIASGVMTVLTFRCPGGTAS